MTMKRKNLLEIKKILFQLIILLNSQKRIKQLRISITVRQNEFENELTEKLNQLKPKTRRKSQYKVIKQEPLKEIQNLLHIDDIITNEETLLFLRQNNSNFTSSTSISFKIFLESLQNYYPILFNKLPKQNFFLFNAQLQKNLTTNSNHDEISLNALEIFTKKEGLKSALMKCLKKVEKEIKQQVNERIVLEIQSLEKTLAEKNKQQKTREAKLLKGEQELEKNKRQAILEIKQFAETQFLKVQKQLITEQEKIDNKFMELNNMEQKINAYSQYQQQKRNEVLEENTLLCKKLQQCEQIIHNLNLINEELVHQNEESRQKIIEFQKQLKKKSQKNKENYEFKFNKVIQPEEDKTTRQFQNNIVKDEISTKRIEIASNNNLLNLKSEELIQQFLSFLTNVLTGTNTSLQLYLEQQKVKKRIDFGELLFPIFNPIVTDLLEIIPELHDRNYQTKNIYKILEMLFQVVHFAFKFKIQGRRILSEELTQIASLSFKFNSNSEFWKQSAQQSQQIAQSTTLYKQITFLFLTDQQVYHQQFIIMLKNFLQYPDWKDYNCIEQPEEITLNSMDNLKYTQLIQITVAKLIILFSPNIEDIKGSLQIISHCVSQDNLVLRNFMTSNFIESHGINIIFLLLSQLLSQKLLNDNLPIASECLTILQTISFDEKQEKIVIAEFAEAQRMTLLIEYLNILKTQIIKDNSLEQILVKLLNYLKKFPELNNQISL